MYELLAPIKAATAAVSADKLDMTTLGLLIAALLTMTEVVKGLTKALISKYSKNGESQVQSSMVDALGKQSKMLDEQGKALAVACDMLSEIKEESADMYRWHEPETEPGVKVWWNRRDLSDAITKLTAAIDGLQQSVNRQHSQFISMETNISEIKSDMDRVKDEVHDLVLRDKYKKSGSSPYHHAVSPLPTKKR